MCGRNVFQIGMYLSVELWVEAIFFYIYIGSSMMLFMFVCCFVIDFCGVAATTFYIFSTLLFFLFFYFIHLFPVEGEQIMQQYSKNLSPTFRCQDSKACHRRFNAKSNVHSMNSIQAPETLSISVCYRICFRAVRACGGSESPRKTDRSRG